MKPFYSPLTNSRLLTVGLIFFCFIFSLNKAEASHGMGADLSFSCIGGNQYELSLQLYRDCSGIAAPASVIINIASASCSQTLSATLSTVVSSEASPLCPSQLSQSTCNGGTLQGVEVYTYTGTVTLPTQCNDWILSYRLGNRNSSITNITTPGSAWMYVETQLNNLDVTCNNSPQFTTPPVPYICNGVPFSYNHGVIDAEGDSLAFSLIAPLDNVGTPVNFVAPYTATQPMATTGTFGFDPLTGQMTFTPNGVQNGVIAVEVREYRNGVLISRSIRDMQIVVINCTNNVPVVAPLAGLSGGSQSGNVISTCEGNVVQFSISATDADVDNLTITETITSNLPGAVVVVNDGTHPASIDVTWTVPSGALSSYTFTATFSDGACPTPGFQIVGYSIQLPAVRVDGDGEFCPPSQNVSLQATPNGSGTGNYSWSPAVGLSCTNCPNPTATVSAPTTYNVTFTDGATGCTATNSVFVDEHTMDLSVGQSAPCYDNTIAFNAPGISDPTTFNFNTSIPQSDGGAVLTVTFYGDLDANNERWDILNESGAIIGTLGPAAGGCGLPAVTISIPISDADIANFAANGVIDFTANATNGVNESECGNDSLVMNLVYCAPTPTANLWCTGDPPLNFRAELNGDPGTTIIPSTTRYDIASIPYANIPIVGTTVSLTDDAVSALQPIGFSFDFFGNTYTDFYISSNGYILFGSSLSGTSLSEQILPNTTAPNNLIALFWEDLDPGNGGQPAINEIRYQTVGTAPNRTLVVEYDAVDHFSAGDNVTGQIHIHETSNCIEMHVFVQPQSQAHTLGIENIDGTIGYAPPSRNGVVWTVAVPEAWSFCPGNDTIGTGISYNWTPLGGVDNPSAQEVNITPISTPSTYTVTADDGTCQISENINISCILLAAECEQFDAKLSSSNEAVILNWRTREEEYNEGFFIERSTDGLNYTRLDWIASSGVGAQEYSFIDRHLIKGTRYYYRLVQVDLDGTEYNFCEVKTVEIPGEFLNSLLVHPNPTKGEINLTFEAMETGTVRIRIFDVLGREVLDAGQFDLQIGRNLYTVDAEKLSPATYFIQVGDEKWGYKAIEKVVKTQ